MNHDEIFKRLRDPFRFKEIEWKIQVTTQDKARGMAVAYLDARAVQTRLDEIVGPFNWRNVYSLWQNNSQICGISIYNEERKEWTTKFDGAENSDIEPIKGGLSDSFKRAANMWGIGRYLYDLEGVWVEIEARGKSFGIKQDQYGRLEAEYNAAVGKSFGSVPKQQAQHETPASPPSNQMPTLPNPKIDKHPPAHPGSHFSVRSVKPSGQSSQMLELVGGDGKAITAFIKASNKDIIAGSRLHDVQIEQKDSKYGPYNIINDYKLVA